MDDESPSPKRRQQCHAAVIETFNFSHAKGQILKSMNAKLAHLLLGPGKRGIAYTSHPSACFSDAILALGAPPCWA